MSNNFYVFKVTWKDAGKKPSVFRFTKERLYLDAYNRYAARTDVQKIEEIK